MSVAAVCSCSFWDSLPLRSRYFAAESRRCSRRIRAQKSACGDSKPYVRVEQFARDAFERA